MRFFLPDTSVSVPIDHAFEQAWNIGPADKTDPRQIAEALNTVGTTFNRLIAAARGQIVVSHKEHPLDHVTEADVGIEKLFRQWVLRHFPTHKIVGEEGPKDQIGAGDWTWYIDPIDGTTNYVDGLDFVTVHIGLVGNGKPLVAYVGVPMFDESYFGYFGGGTFHQKGRQVCPVALKKGRKTHRLRLGTEYMENRLDEKEKFENLLQKLDAEPVRKKSIGFNLISLLDGSTDAFYKPSAKYWDVIAPLGIIYLSDPSQWDVDLWIPNHPVFSPFSDDPILLQHLNQQHKGNCRVGLVSATPKANPEIKKAIFREFFDSEV